jgi:hypothetical protein
MDISRSLKDIIFITPFILCSMLYMSVSIIIYLSLLLWSNMIFIYESIGEINVK